MNNLFILHTQYNIILGSAIALNKCKGNCNDLIIYAEFSVSDDYRKSINKIFDQVYYIRDRFQPKPKGILKSEIALWKEYRMYRNSPFYEKRYDHVFLSQERPLDCMILGHIKQSYKECICSDIEEDCYYSSRSELNNPKYKAPKRKNIIHSLRKILYGRKYLHQTNWFFYGCSSFYNDYYVIYPTCLRLQLQSRNVKIVGVNKDEIAIAVNTIYGQEKTTVPQVNKYYLFFFDLLERYKDPEGIKVIVEKLLSKASSEDAILLLKYHPRETQKYTIKGPVIEVPTVVPAEKLLCDLMDKNVIVFGNATTSIIVANLLGYKTYSIAKINGSDNVAMLDKFVEMGLSVPSTIENIEI